MTNAAETAERIAEAFRATGEAKATTSEGWDETVTVTVSRTLSRGRYQQMAEIIVGEEGVDEILADRRAAWIAKIVRQATA